MKLFEMPKAELVKFALADVITTSTEEELPPPPPAEPSFEEGCVV